VLPRVMRFLCSKGIGTGAKHLLTNPEKLKAGLIAHWPTNVADEITETGSVPLTGSLKALVESTPFEIFGPHAIEDVLRDLEGTAFYVSQFGGGLPARPPITTPPTDLRPHENRYVGQLLLVYAERRGQGPVDLQNLDQEPRDRQHFEMCRRQFYCAESLREFARDATRQGTFEGFQEDVLSIITSVLYDDHRNAFGLLNTAALYSVADVRDKQGVCHQLVNENRIDWIDT
jgi:hypothetical protein